MAVVEARDLRRSYGSFTALDGVDFVVPPLDQRRALDHLLRVATAHLDPDFFRTLDDVSIAQVVERPTGRRERHVGCKALSLRSKDRDVHGDR